MLIQGGAVVVLRASAKLASTNYIFHILLYRYPISGVPTLNTLVNALWFHLLLEFNVPHSIYYYEIIYDKYIFGAIL